MAKLPLSTANLEPANFDAKSVSIFFVKSIWSTVLVDKISPTFLITTLSFSLEPSGVDWSGIFGISKRYSLIDSKSTFNNSFSFFRSELIVSIFSFNEALSEPEALSFPNSSDNFFLEDGSV